MSNKLTVLITGDTRGLQRAFGRVDRQADQFARKSARLGQRMRRGGMFAAAGLSALGFSRYVDDAAETVLKHFGVGGDAAVAITDMTVGVGQLAAETGKLNAKFLGKAGLVGAAGAAAFGLTTLFLKATGLDEKLKDLGATVYDLTRLLPGLNDPMDQFQGKAAPTQTQSSQLRSQARALLASGMTQAQVEARLVQANPQFAPRDVQTLSRGITIQGGIHLHGVQNVQSLEQQLGKRYIGRPHRRRGAR